MKIFCINIYSFQDPEEAGGCEPCPRDAGGPVPPAQGRRLRRDRLREELQRLPAHGGLRARPGAAQLQAILPRHPCLHRGNPLRHLLRQTRRTCECCHPCCYVRFRYRLDIDIPPITSLSAPWSTPGAW